MRPLIAAVALAMVVATGACWFPDKGLAPDASPPSPDAPPLPPDARLGPLDCNNKPLPPVNTDFVKATGRVTLAVSGDPAISVTIQAFLNTTNPGEQGELQHTTTNENGEFNMQLATGGGRVDVYLKVTASGYLDNYFYPAYPVGGDTVTLDLRLFKASDLTTLTGGWGIMQKADEAVFLVAAVDCIERPLGGVTVTTDPPGDGTMVHYFIDKPTVMPNMSARATDATTGVAVAANVPVGPTTIGGTVLSPDDHSRTLTMYSHKILSPVAGAMIQTELAP